MVLTPRWFCDWTTTLSSLSPLFEIGLLITRFDQRSAQNNFVGQRKFTAFFELE
jgi:hypothetical protein